VSFILFFLITFQTHSKTSTNKKFAQILAYKEIKVLVIGATGAGKSSLINLFYIWSQEWELQDFTRDKRVLIKTKYLDGDGSGERNVQNQGESQTFTANLYNFDLKNPEKGLHFSLSFLDTPGIGDTKGLDQDEENFDVILESVQKTSDLNAILLVMNGSDPKISTRLKYIMTKLQGMIPDTLADNLVALLTNVDLKPNLDINQVLDFKLDKSRIFYYNNQLFQLSPDDFEDHNILRRAEQSFRDSINTLSEMLNLISSRSLKPTTSFMKIKESRDTLKKELVKCNDAEAKIYKKKTELQDLGSQVAAGNLKIGDLQKQLNQVTNEEIFEEVPTSYHNTTCLTCKNCCHEHCGLQETTQQGSSYFRSCFAFGSQSNCLQCKHEFTSHVHLRHKYVKRIKQVPKVDPQVQQALLNAQKNTDSINAASNAIDAELKKLDAELEKHHDKIQQVVEEMRKVCSRFDYMKEIEACINVLDEQIEAATNDFSQSLSQDDCLKLDGLKKTRARMEKFKNGLIKHLKSSKKG